VCVKAEGKKEDGDIYRREIRKEERMRSRRIGVRIEE
jgi:hypothetical protein